MKYVGYIIDSLEKIDPFFDQRNNHGEISHIHPLEDGSADNVHKMRRDELNQ